MSYPIQRQARVAGFLYTSMIPTAIFAMIFVPSTLFVSNDIATTLANIQANEFLFRSSIAVSLFVQLLHLAVGFTLYRLFKSIHHYWAVSILVFSVISVPMAMLNELTHVAITYLIHDDSQSVEQIHRHLTTLLQLHEDGRMITGIFWGLWLFPMASLILKSGWMPKILAWALLAAGTAYLCDTVAWLFNLQLGFAFSELFGWGELLFPLWLLVRGVKVTSDG